MIKGIRAKFSLRRGDFEFDVAFEVPSSGITGVFGPSGSGKSTLLRCIAGLEPGALGALQVNDETWQDSVARLFVPAHRRRIGYVFQDARLFAHLSVRGNLEYGLKRVRNARSGFAFDQVVESAGIAGLLDRRVSGLSGGERSRVAMARALLTDPVMLLMDEPLAALDAGARAEILPYLERLHEVLSIPILYVSHAIDEVARLADHMLSLQKGQLAAAGETIDMLTRLDLSLAHSDEAAAVLEAVVESHDKEFNLALLEFSGGHLAVPEEHLPAGTAVRVRILARDVSLSLEQHRNTSILNVFPARIVEISDDRPAQSIVKLDAAGSALLARITRRSVHALGLRTGLQVYAQVKSVALLR